MPVSDYVGVHGFAVDAHSVEDVKEALDRLHTQICDELEAMDDIKNQVFKRSPGLEAIQEKKAELEHALEVLETAMNAL